MKPKVKISLPILHRRTNKLGSVIYITDSRIRFGEALMNAQSQAAVKEQEIGIGSLKKFFSENKTSPDHLTLCIPRTQVSIKYLSFPTLNDSELKQMVSFELNNLLPLKPEELIYDYAVIRKGPDDFSHLMLVVAPKDIILKHALALKEVGLVPDEISVSTVSLFKQFLSQKRQQANYLLINIDDGFMDIIYISGQNLTFSRAVTLSRAGEIVNAIKDIEFTATVLRDKDYPIDKIILSGSGLDLQELAQGLEKAIPYQVEVDDNIGVIKGTILNNNGYILHNINLLPDELRIQKKIGIRKKAFVYLAIMLFVNLFLLANIGFLKIRAKESYLALLNSEIQKIDAEASLLQRKLINVQILRGYLNSDRLTLGLLSELYNTAPDGVYLGSLDIFNRETQGTMLVAGQAKDSDTALKFVNAIKKTAFIKSADINRITKKSRSPGDQSVDFEIKSYFLGYKL